ncbi:MAG TPA: hypothetical protein VGI36_09490 [Candidatus Binataceae bacterium]
MNLLSEAKRLAPQLAETAAVDRELRRLSDQTWKILLDGGFVRRFSRPAGAAVRFR